MKIIHKLILGFLSVTSLIWLVGYLAVKVSEESLEESIGQREVLLAERVLNEMEMGVYSRIVLFQEYSNDRILQEALQRSNRVLESPWLRHEARKNAAPASPRGVGTAPGSRTSPGAFVMDPGLSEELKEKIEFYESNYDHSAVRDVLVANRHGYPVAATGNAGASRHDLEEWWQRAKKEGLYVADSGVRGPEEYLIDAGIRVNDREGGFTGVIKLTLDAREAIDAIKRLELAANRGHTVYTLFSDDGRVIYSTGGAWTDKGNSFILNELNERREGVRYDGFMKTNNGDIETFISHAHSNGYRDFSGLGWTIVVEHSKDDILAPVNKLRTQVLVVSTFLTALAIAISLHISRSFSKPVRRLRDAALEFGKGNLDKRIEARSDDEIGELAAAFDSMGERLKATIASLDAELSERKKMENLVRHMAYHDHLTGLPNRLLFVDRLEQVMARGFWHKKHAAVLFLDLDRFKAVNDTLGHSAGDELIKTVAERLKCALRDGDTVARFGGDEFTVLLQDVAREEDVHLIIEKMLKALEKPALIRGLEVYVNASIGVSIYPNHGESTEVLLKNSDIAMYCAKEKGGNTYAIYGPEMASAAFLSQKHGHRLDELLDLSGQGKGAKDAAVKDRAA